MPKSRSYSQRHLGANGAWNLHSLLALQVAIYDRECARYLPNAWNSKGGCMSPVEVLSANLIRSLDIQSARVKYASVTFAILLPWTISRRTSQTRIKSGSILLMHSCIANELWQTFSIRRTLPIQKTGFLSRNIWSKSRSTSTTSVESANRVSFTSRQTWRITRRTCL
jgi:hypothetical protein